MDSMLMSQLEEFESGNICLGTNRHPGWSRDTMQVNKLEFQKIIWEKKNVFLKSKVICKNLSRQLLHILQSTELSHLSFSSFAIFEMPSATWTSSAGECYPADEFVI